VTGECVDQRRTSASARKIRTAIVSTVWLHRDALATALQDDPLLEIVGHFAVTNETARTLKAQVPDVEAILFDAPVASHSAVIDEIRQVLPSSLVIALGVNESESEIVQCAKAGMAGYIGCHARLSELPALVTSIICNELVCSPGVAATLFRRIASDRLADRSGERELTSRERQVLELIRQGLANKEIADALHISEATVKNHVHNLLEKLQVKRRLQAARMEIAAFRVPLRQPA
jgi:two-component system nitrate/nitrite response regulator NarL